MTDDLLVGGSINKQKSVSNVVMVKVPAFMFNKNGLLINVSFTVSLFLKTRGFSVSKIEGWAVPKIVINQSLSKKLN